jgi:hypothetical protein
MICERLGSAASQPGKSLRVTVLRHSNSLRMERRLTETNQSVSRITWKLVSDKNVNSQTHKKAHFTTDNLHVDRIPVAETHRGSIRSL